MKKITEIHTEYSSLGPPSPIGGGAVIVNGGNIREVAADLGDGTTQDAALKSILMPLDALQTEEMEHPIIVWTKSKYAAELISGNWTPDVNLELVQHIKSRIEEIGDVQVVRHEDETVIGANHRQRAKQLAREAIKHRK